MIHWRNCLASAVPKLAVIAHDLIQVWVCWVALHAARYSMLVYPRVCRMPTCVPWLFSLRKRLFSGELVCIAVYGVLQASLIFGISSNLLSLV